MKYNIDKATIKGNHKIISDRTGFKIIFMESGTFMLPDIKNVPIGTMYVIKNWSQDKNTVIPVKTVKGNRIDLGNNTYTQNYNLKQFECMSIIHLDDDFSWYLF
jgi:hypothetical protein